jgi:hypothetical protein
MTFEIETNTTDDPPFVALVIAALSRLAEEQSPAEVVAIRIDNWFAHKWLEFSGVGRVGFFMDFRLERDTALDEFRQDKVTFPPFTPNRVIEEYCFRRNERGRYDLAPDAPLVHQRRLSRSAANLHKRVANVTDSAVFAWFSSNSKANGRGSLMVYEVNGTEVQTWYTELLKAGNWTVSQTKSIARDRMVALIEPF